MGASVAKILPWQRSHIGPTDVLVLVLTLAWTASMAVQLVRPSLNPAGPAPSLILVGVPLALISGLAFLALQRTPLVLLGTAWTVTGLIAFVAAHVLAAEPLVGLAIPAMLVSGLVGRRFPVATVTTVFFLSGTFGTIRAFTSIPPGGVVDLIIAGLLAGSLMAYAAQHRDRPLFLWPGIAVLAVYLFITLVQSLDSSSLSASFEAVRLTGWYLLVVPVVAYANWDPRVRVHLAHAIVATVAAVSAYAVFRWMVGPADAEVGQTARSTILLNGELKLIGSFSSRHQLGAWMGLVLPFCVAFSLTVGGRWRWLSLATIVMASVALLASEARAGLVGAVAGVALVIVLQQAARGFPGVRLGSLVATVGSIIVLAAVAFSLTLNGSEESSDRLTNILTPGQDPAFVARTYKWRDAIDTIQEHPFGQGIGSGQQSGGVGTVASVNLESSYLKVAYEQGIALAVLFALALLGLLGGLVHRGVSSPDRMRAGIAIGAAGTLLSFLIVMSLGLYVEGLQALAGWLIVGLGVAQFASPDEVTIQGR